MNLQEVQTHRQEVVNWLNLLKSQIEMAIRMIESGHIVLLTETERLEHVSRFGEGAVAIGDFVIRERSFGTKPTKER